mgnify:FL=1
MSRDELLELVRQEKKISTKGYQSKAKLISILLGSPPTTTTTTRTTTTTTTTRKPSASLDGTSDKKNKRMSDLSLTFLGTASCVPGLSRGVSSCALKWSSTGSSKASSVAAFSSESYTREISETGAEVVVKKGGQGDSQGQGHSRGDSEGTWIVDCGEGTQLQVTRSNSEHGRSYFKSEGRSSSDDDASDSAFAGVHPSKITRIFVTHSHGDHVFGLPGLLCLIGQDQAGGKREMQEFDSANELSSRETRRLAELQKKSEKVIEIYGPVGLRRWLRESQRYSKSFITPKYRVHELHGVQLSDGWTGSTSGRVRWTGGGPVSSQDKNVDLVMREMLAFDDDDDNGIASSSGQNVRNDHQKSTGRGKEERFGTKKSVYVPSSPSSSPFTYNIEPVFPPGEEGTSNDDGATENTSTSPIASTSADTSEVEYQFGEVAGGRDIYPTYGHQDCYKENPIWEILKAPPPKDGGPPDPAQDPVDRTRTQPIRITAVPMSHTVPTVGYIFEECVDFDGAPETGTLNAKVARAFVDRNRENLKSMGYVDPNKVLGVLKNLKVVSSDGDPDPVFNVLDVKTSPPTIVDSIHYSEYMEGGGNKKRGRKIAILGDTNSGIAALNVARNADLLIHEATNGFVSGGHFGSSYLDCSDRFDASRFTSIDKNRLRWYFKQEAAENWRAIKHGHSTPLIAGELAGLLNAKRLVMNHFSSRFPPRSLVVNGVEVGAITMTRMCKLAERGVLSGLKNRIKQKQKQNVENDEDEEPLCVTEVEAAEDFSTIFVHK